MSSEQVLYLFGEVSIALAGFAGIAAVLGKTDNALAKVRVRMVVMISILVLV